MGMASIQRITAAMPINPELFLSFVGTSLLIAISPGPSNAFLLAQTFSKGRAAGLQTALGFALGGVCHTLLAVIGLSALLKTSQVAYNIVLWLGAFYLCLLGYKNIRAAFSPSPKQEIRAIQANQPSQPNLIVQAMLTELLNPKVALFFIAFIPQFVEPSLGSVSLQLLFFGLMYPVLAFPIDYINVYLGDKIASLFRQYPNAPKLIDATSGVIFIILAINLFISI